MKVTQSLLPEDIRLNVHKPFKIYFMGVMALWLTKVCKRPSGAAYDATEGIAIVK
jgi:hypothetical protein